MVEPVRCTFLLTPPEILWENENARSFAKSNNAELLLCYGTHESRQTKDGGKTTDNDCTCKKDFQRYVCLSVGMVSFRSFSLFFQRRTSLVTIRTSPNPTTERQLENNKRTADFVTSQDIWEKGRSRERLSRRDLHTTPQGHPDQRKNQEIR